MTTNLLRMTTWGLLVKVCMKNYRHEQLNYVLSLETFVKLCPYGPYLRDFCAW